MYFMDRVPQNISYNPAFIPEVNFHLGLPGIGGVAAHAYNSGFNYNELEGFLDGLGSEGYNPDDFVNSIGDYNTFFAEARANVFSTGFKLKGKGYLSIGITSNNIIVSRASSDIAFLVADMDDISEDDFPIVVDELDFLTNNYITFGFTYARLIGKNLTIGISPRLNFNGVGIQTSNIGYKIELEESQSGIEYNTSLLGDVIVGLPVEINPEARNGNELDLDKGLFPDDWLDDLSAGDLLKNKSFSIDLGATYLLNKWTFSASVLNIGSTNWTTNGYRLNGSDESINIKEESKVKVNMPTKIYVGANRQFSPKWNYGLLFHNTFYHTGSKASATLSLNGYVGSMLSTSVSYTAGYKYNNVGLGLRLRFLPGTDLYFVTDNIVQMFAYKNAYRASAAFGINLSFGLNGNNNTTKIPEEE